MIKHWSLNNNKLIPPNYHLKPNPEAKLWLSNLSREGIIYEQTGHFLSLKHQILIGLNKGFLTEAYKYTNKTDIEFQLPQELSADGISEQNVILKRLKLIREYLKLLELVTPPFIAISSVAFCFGMLMHIVLVQLLL